MMVATRGPAMIKLVNLRPLPLVAMINFGYGGGEKAHSPLAPGCDGSGGGSEWCAMRLPGSANVAGSWEGLYHGLAV